MPLTEADLQQRNAVFNENQKAIRTESHSDRKRFCRTPRPRIPGWRKTRKTRLQAGLTFRSL
jgi:hypothetical protein